MAKKPVEVKAAPIAATIKVEPVKVPEFITNFVTPVVEGMTIRLHDGTRLAYGDVAETTPEHAALLRDKGLAK